MNFENVINFTKLTFKKNLNRYYIMEMYLSIFSTCKLFVLSIILIILSQQLNVFYVNSVNCHKYISF